MNDQSLSKALPWVLFGIAATIAIVFAMKPSNEALIKNLQNEKEEIKQASSRREDSLKAVIIDKDDEYKKKMLILARSKDSVQELYDKSKIQLDEIKVSINNYLTASDSVRFSTFRRIILTEMGEIPRN